MQIKKIENYPKYSVSDDGRVFGPYGEVGGWITPAGYKKVAITNEEGKKQVFVHRLVAEAFIGGKTEERIFIDHIDSNRQNNRAENLRWCSQSENLKFAYQNGRFPERQTPRPVILENLKTGTTEAFESIWAAAKKYGLPYWHLNEIYHRKGNRRSTYGFTIYPA